jgi:hypothetical protein
MNVFVPVNGKTMHRTGTHQDTARIIMILKDVSK